ncbi:RNA polymerase sigma-70 factor, ECF subfamily [Pedobacter sp. ok626]|uniref:RNA polymerase sigma factor n=1 Tax=Pedobacter sp. ok626 TaxID=1761882 RepID=UPI000890A5FA|nr:sigma-70 family RNA polymerase sigma factor [Pedobacter sp. ok626]SDL03226.1 RNA polymerase sigma-70 factor, ECF subfamily [Pedobacter sp. ok626]
MSKVLFNETQLITRLNDGDESAFVKLFEAYSPVLMSFMSKLNIEAEDINDSIQQTFLKIWEHRAKLDPNVPLKNYIITVAKNDLYNTIKKNIVAKKHNDLLIAQEPQIFEHPSSDLTKVLNEILDSLPEKRAKVFKMSRIQGYSNNEIAQELGISKSTVENHINNSSSVVKKLLRNFGFWVTTIFFFILP